MRVPRTRHAAAAVAAGASLLVAACSNAQTVKQTITAQTIGGKAGFSVAALTVTHGSKVELIVKNTTDRPHGFSIDELGVHRIVESAKPITVRFTASRKGTFRIYCQLHPAHGTAELVVPQ